MKYLRIHKQVEDGYTKWHICSVKNNNFDIPKKIQEMDLWRKIEVVDTFVSDNPESEVAYIDKNANEIKWKHTDDKWYKIIRKCHHLQTYNIDTGEVLNRLEQYSENLEEEMA